MTTSQTQYLSDVLSGEPIPEEKLVYFRARLRNRLHAMVLSLFLKLEKEKHFSKAAMARRLAKKPEQIGRWLNAPSNWTIDTLSDLLLGMGHEPVFKGADLLTGAVIPSRELWERENLESAVPNISAPEQAKPKSRLTMVGFVSSATNAASGDSMFPLNPNSGDLGYGDWDPKDSEQEPIRARA